MVEMLCSDTCLWCPETQMTICIMYGFQMEKTLAEFGYIMTSNRETMSLKDKSEWWRNREQLDEQLKVSWQNMYHLPHSYNRWLQQNTLNWNSPPCLNKTLWHAPPCLNKALWHTPPCLNKTCWHVPPYLYEALWHAPPCLNKTCWHAPPCLYEALWHAPPCLNKTVWQSLHVSTKHFDMPLHVSTKRFDMPLHVSTKHFDIPLHWDAPEGKTTEPN